MSDPPTTVLRDVCTGWLWFRSIFYGCIFCAFFSVFGRARHPILASRIFNFVKYFVLNYVFIREKVRGVQGSMEVVQRCWNFSNKNRTLEGRARHRYTRTKTGLLQLSHKARHEGENSLRGVRWVMRSVYFFVLLLLYMFFLCSCMHELLTCQLHCFWKGCSVFGCFDVSCLRIEVANLFGLFTSAARGMLFWKPIGWYPVVSRRF